MTASAMPKKDPSIVNMAIQPYLFFGGRCEEALEFYRTQMDAKIDVVMKFSQSPTPMPPGMIPEGWENKVMFASFRIRGTTLMASDGMGKGEGFKGFSLSLSVRTEDDAKQVSQILSAGGSVQMPLTKTFYSPCFGMVTDQFGVSWMVFVPAEFA
jgi:PhnB protein